MATYYRQYRVVAEDTWRRPDLDAGGHLGSPTKYGQHLAAMAERELRGRLAAGECPQVILVSPEFGRPEPCIRGRIARRVHAWTDPESATASDWLHACHAMSALETRSAPEPDEYGPFADDGAVILREARMAGLVVSSWLAPVAEQLESTYGVPLVVNPAPDVPAPVVEAQPPWVMRGFLAPDQVKTMRQEFKRAHRAGETERDETDPGDTWGTVELCQTALPLLQTVGRHFGLPVDAVTSHVIRYGPGDDFDEHTDATEEYADSLDRTVSFSLLLSEPGEDFTGGKFYANGERVKLRAGDLVGFTARTPHRVGAVKSGRRLVWVGFAEVTR